MESNKVKVIFDTDMGSDIDDAVALAYLLAEPRCELLGITTVSGQPYERAKLASAICYKAGKSVLIVPGTEDRLDGPSRQPDVPQAAVLSNWEHDDEFSDKTSTEFIAEIVRENPYEVVLLAVGPMTNIAKLFIEHPDIPGILKSLRLMCGRTPSYTGLQVSEWNAHCDPYAASIVYSTAVLNHMSLGLDVTTQVVMDSNQVKNNFQHPELELVYEMFQIWFKDKKRDHVTFHDPLAAVTTFEDSICGYEMGTVSVSRQKGRLDGITNWVADKSGPHKIGITVNPDRFFSTYFGVFS